MPVAPAGSVAVRETTRPYVEGFGEEVVSVTLLVIAAFVSKDETTKSRESKRGRQAVRKRGPGSVRRGGLEADLIRDLRLMMPANV